MTKYDPKDDPSSWQHDKRAHPGAPFAGVPGGPIPVSGPMTLEQHQWLHPRTANADFAAQEAQVDRAARRKTRAPKPSEYSKESDRLSNSGADYSFERHANGDRTFYVYPKIQGQDANGDYLHPEGPEQQIKFRADGSRK